MSGAVRGGQQFAQRRVIVDSADNGCVNLFRSERTGSGIHRADIRRHGDALEGKPSPGGIRQRQHLYK